MFCPALPYHEGDRTFVHVSELKPGYYWLGGISKDVRDLWMFKRPAGYFSFFHKPNFDKGQEFVCHNDSHCAFRNIRFTASGQACQLAYFLPDLGNTDGTTGRSETPYSVILIHCGTAVPFRKKHFKLEPGRITISYPDPTRTTSSRVVSDRIVCRMAVNGDGSAWQELGFDKYVDVARHRGLSVDDCRNILMPAGGQDTPNKPPAGEDKSPAKSAFTSCFDNPQNCK